MSSANTPKQAVPSANPLLEAALAYADQGFAVFPLKPRDKRPATPNGLKDASTDPVQIAAWWRAMPDANIGILAGGGLVVVDVDAITPENEAWVAALPPTFTVRTGRGFHFYYRGEGRNTAGRIPGIDTRGGGAGYVVAPPSVHPDGHRYQVEIDAPLAPVPAAVVTLMNETSAASPSGARASTAGTPSGSAEVMEGGRNHYLTKVAGRLQRNGLLTFEALDSINERDCSPPLPEHEVRTIVRSIGRHAPAEPVEGARPEQAENLFYPVDTLPTDLGPEGVLDEVFRRGQVEYWPKGNAYRYTAGGRRQEKPADLFKEQLLLWAAAAEGVRLTDQRVNGYFALVAPTFLAAAIEKVHGNLLPTGQEKPGQIEAFVEALTGEVRPLDVVVIRQLLWQVRRKLAGLPVTHHLMVVLVGPQGGGKSSAIEKFSEPVADVCYALSSLTILNDERQRVLLERGFLLIAEELQGAGKTGVDALKNCVTAGEVTYRILGKNDHRVAKNNASFLGSSNSSIVDSMYDTSGARRFWEIRCSELIDWAAINSISYLDLWRSIDEQGPAPVLPHLKKLRKHQEAELKAKDSVEHFLEDVYAPTTEGKGVPAGRLYEDYKTYCEDANLKPLSSPRFGKRLQSLRVVRERHADGVRYFVKKRVGA